MTGVDMQACLAGAVAGVKTELTGTAGVTGVDDHTPTEEGTPNTATVTFVEDGATKTLVLEVHFDETQGIGVKQ